MPLNISTNVFVVEVYLLYPEVMNISLVGGEFTNIENNFKEKNSQTIEIGKYVESVKCCNIIAEMRTYIEKDVREGMSKPEFINYVEL